MKNLWMGLAAAALVMSLCVTGALAAGRHGPRLGDGTCDNRGTRCGISFTDADGDGIWDICGTRRGVNCVDADGDGVCDNRGAGCGINFTDADGDGICDNFGTGE